MPSCVEASGTDTDTESVFEDQEPPPDDADGSGGGESSPPELGAGSVGDVGTSELSSGVELPSNVLDDWGSRVAEDGASQGTDERASEVSESGASEVVAGGAFEVSDEGASEVSEEGASEVSEDAVSWLLDGEPADDPDGVPEVLTSLTSGFVVSGALELESEAWFASRSSSLVRQAGASDTNARLTSVYFEAPSER